MLFTVKIRRKRDRWPAILCCLCSRTVHVLLRQGEGQKGRKRLGRQASHVTSGSARYNRCFCPGFCRCCASTECARATSGLVNVEIYASDPTSCWYSCVRW
ncbi:hypothetical protein BDW02DRAFT_125018 [Decorospora gaudefroyi]|uniref:Uncharacterized protein n=1 Tax=Decorospora gaudefroyi TaxID=184978 RepID=A0A6A5JZL6_9PLEO|nr:hypothetical protein BDW02DRAFT_125018 [Decorospora gaudefroyi]